MNENTLESFINYCDEMQIAEEGFLSKIFKFRKKSNSNVNNKTSRYKYNDLFRTGEGPIDTLTDEDKIFFKNEVEPEFKKCLNKVKMLVNKCPKNDNVEIKYHVPNDSLGYYINTKMASIDCFPCGFEASVNASDSDIKILDKFEDELYKISTSNKNFSISIEKCKDNTDTPYFVNTRFYFMMTVEFKRN